MGEELGLSHEECMLFWDYRTEEAWKKELKGGG